MSGQPLALARIAPVPRPGSPVTEPSNVRVLTPREKAAVIVRFLLAEGTNLPLSKLPEHIQASLTEQMGQMRMIDRRTLSAVVDEFMTELEQVGLSFPGGIEGALTVMDGHISVTAANRLRRLAGASSKADPWDRLTALPVERLLPVLQDESVEVAAVMLSKLPVAKSAELLGKLPGERARRVAYAVSLTGNVDPETVRRIGLSLASQLDAQPPKAFETGPVERVGAILNVSAAMTRDDVLKGLDEADSDFAELVRKAIFTFIHIPQRLAARDVPKLVRIIDQPVLVTALTAAQSNPDLRETAEFFLSNLSTRMSQGLREEIEARGRVKEKDAEDTMSAIVLAIRQMEATGEIILIKQDD